MSSLRDGLGGEEIQPSGVEISGAAVYTHPYFLGSVVSENGFDETNTGRLESTGIGSPVAYGAKVQAGSGDLSAGSTLAVTFGVAFTAEPHIVCSYVDNPIGGATVIGSNVSTTGFDAIGDTASKAFNWIAVGV